MCVACTTVWPSLFFISFCFFKKKTRFDSWQQQQRQRQKLLRVRLFPFVLLANGIPPINNNNNSNSNNHSFILCYLPYSPSLLRRHGSHYPPSTTLLIIFAMASFISLLFSFLILFSLLSSFVSLRNATQCTLNTPQRHNSPWPGVGGRARWKNPEVSAADPTAVLRNSLVLRLTLGSARLGSHPLESSSTYFSLLKRGREDYVNIIIFKSRKKGGAVEFGDRSAIY